MTIKAVRGMKDVLSPEVANWQKIEAIAREVFASFGFSEIKIPMLEHTELFARSIGEATDIVEKEMYTFSDRSGDSLTLRPEATAGVLRAYIEHKLHAQPGPHKLYCFGPMFRHERPQKGRLRQFYQIDAEILGDEGPLVDAEMMALLAHFLERLGLSEVTLLVNSLGCPACRPRYRQALTGFLAGLKGRLCEDCARRLDTNPLRVLDCKVESCKEAVKGAPVIAEFLCSDCERHFTAVTENLELARVSFAPDPHLVRGLDYYRRTTFEAVTAKLGSQDAVAGGGRYDGLIEELGGPAEPGIGFAAGVERLAMLLPEPGAQPGPDLFLAALGEEPRRFAFARVQELRKSGLWVEMSSQDKSLKAQMRRADKLGARKVLILGEQEIKTGRAPLKDMAQGSQREVDITRLAGEITPQGAE